ncbi:MAG: glycoside hydrolase family 5 protein [Deltaproteobacteria bacterium]|nr:glycoside hydrolase family 5 protein [Deltaproteobacteria bacterium]
MGGWSSCTSQQAVPDVVNAAADTASDSGGGTEADTNTASDTSLEQVIGATEMAADMGIGMGIANTLENTTAWETGWGLPEISNEFITGMAANGMKTVRVPVAWDTYSVNGVIPDDKMARVREVVEMIIAADMYCIVNIHWDGGWIRNEGNDNEYQLTDDVRVKFESYWQQIAAEFSDVGANLVFEAMNEEGQYWIDGIVDGTPDYASLNELNQLFVDTVRASGGYNQIRNLMISGFATDIEKTCVAEFGIPTDPAGADKLLLSIHYFTPYSFCGLETPVDWNGIVYPETTWGTTEDTALLLSLFEKLATFTSIRNIPVVVGEYGVTVGGDDYLRETDSRILWMTSVLQACLENGFVPLLWDGGTEVNRMDGSLSFEFQQVLTMAGL